MRADARAPSRTSCKTRRHRKEDGLPRSPVEQMQLQMQLMTLLLAAKREFGFFTADPVGPSRIVGARLVDGNPRVIAPHPAKALQRLHFFLKKII